MMPDEQQRLLDGMKNAYPHQKWEAGTQRIWAKEFESLDYQIAREAMKLMLKHEDFPVISKFHHWLDHVQADKRRNEDDFELPPPPTAEQKQRFSEFVRQTKTLLAKT